MDIQKLVADDQPLAIAFMAAAGSCIHLAYPPAWPMLGSDDVGEETPCAIAATKLATFVRANPDAPTEALYITAAYDAIHDGKLRYAELAPEFRLAYYIFRKTLLLADRFAAHEAELLRQAEAAEAPPRPPIPADETTLETWRDGGDFVSHAFEPRKMVIIEGTGELPGHVREPAEPPAPIGAENVQVGAGLTIPSSPFTVHDSDRLLEKVAAIVGPQSAQLEELADALRAKLAELGERKPAPEEPKGVDLEAQAAADARDAELEAAERLAGEGAGDEAPAEATETAEGGRQPRRRRA